MKYKTLNAITEFFSEHNAIIEHVISVNEKFSYLL